VAIRDRKGGEDDEAAALLGHLKAPNETQGDAFETRQRKVPRNISARNGLNA
jgi:hypothetical protein